MTEETKVKRPPTRKKIGEGGVKRSRIAYNEIDKLSVEGKDPNYVYRWVNTDDDKWRDRVDVLRKRGYIYDNEAETSDDGVKASSIGSAQSKPVGNGTKAVLMKQRKEFYEEDKRHKADEVDRREAGMKRDIEKLKDSEGSYGDGLKMS